MPIFTAHCTFAVVLVRFLECCSGEWVVASAVLGAWPAINSASFRVYETTRMLQLVIVVLAWKLKCRDEEGKEPNRIKDERVSLGRSEAKG